MELASILRRMKTDSLYDIYTFRYFLVAILLPNAPNKVPPANRTSIIKIRSLKTITYGKVMQRR